LASTDIPNALKLYGVYALPVGAKQQFGGNHFLTRTVLGDWAISFIYTKTSGSPLSVGGVNCKTPDSCFPDLNPAFTGPVRINGAYGKGQTAKSIANVQYLNYNAFIPTPGNGAYNFGDAPRTAPYKLFNLGSYNLNTGLKRSFPIWRDAQFIFQADAFNVTNHVQFNGPSTSLSSPTSFGVITSQSNAARQWQLAGKINF